MRKFLLVLAAMALVCGAVFAETVIEKVDRLHEEEMHRENFDFIKDSIGSAGNDTEKAELYWRLARTTLEIGDLLEQEGAEEDELLDTFVEGEEYADISIDLNPDSYWGYYWKSANIGRWGETKGILNSLFKAKPMRDILRTALGINPEHADSFYVLGIMYRKVPGRPVSFGSSNKAVSLGRKAIDAQRRQFETGIDNEIKLTFYMELARSLHQRDWSSSKRRKEQKEKAEDYADERDVLEKNFNYEGTLDIPSKSDREEAIEMMDWVVSEFEKKGTLTNSEKVDLEEALVDLADWTN